MILTTDRGVVREVLGVLFDMDGTLVDSGAVTERTWQAWADRHGLGDTLVIEHGRPAMATIEACLPDATAEQKAAHEQEMSLAERADLVGVVPMPGAREVVAWLDSMAMPWAVVTSADRALATARLEVSGFFPRCMVTWDDIVHGKPDPEPFLRGAEVLGLPISSCLVVEDAPAGVQAGLASGAVTAALNGHPADVAITTLADLLARLRIS